MFQKCQRLVVNLMEPDSIKFSRVLLTSRSGLSYAGKAKDRREEMENLKIQNETFVLMN